MSRLAASKLSDSFIGEYERIADIEWADTREDGGWLLLWCRWGTFHVVPLLDGLLHTVAEGDDCICGPEVEMLEDGSYMATHSSLDGRELHE